MYIEWVKLQIRNFFNQIVMLFFLFLQKNICCGYSLEVPHWGTFNEYPLQMFSMAQIWIGKYAGWSGPSLPEYVYCPFLVLGINNTRLSYVRKELPFIIWHGYYSVDNVMSYKNFMTTLNKTWLLVRSFMAIKYSLKVIWYLHLWSFHRKFMKRAKGLFHNFIWNDYSCKILLINFR